LLVEVWLRLIEKHGEMLPSLVFVGKLGWKVNDLLKRLRSTNYVDGRIITVHNASDVELASLYRGCLVTLFPSFAEGWGLPVGESLSYGKPCIASIATSIPEVGGAFVRHVDPYDIDAMEAEVERALFNSEYLESWTRRIAEKFVARRWKDVAEDFLVKVDAAVAESDPGIARTTFGPMKEVSLKSAF
jgi:glycosyltransferase involved in cell wall biosynthesis